MRLELMGEVFDKLATVVSRFPKEKDAPKDMGKLACIDVNYPRKLAT